MPVNKTALIIGASRGLGLGLVQRLSEQGWQVTATVRDLHKPGGPQTIPEVSVETLDINDLHSVDAFTAKLKGQVFDLLFVNAGVSGPRPQSAAQATAQELGDLFLTNATAPVRLAGRMIQQIRPDTGVLAFMSSVLGSVMCPQGNDMALYKASKAALNSITNSFVTELPEPRPTVLSMHPGWVKTDMGGEGADIDVHTSTEGIVTQINAYAGKGGHHFINYKGEPIPW
ncbi:MULTISPECIES: SDR family oxidoreductase [unclassified Pseudomonas]|uniref:SDR family oxidoreductase n=1 Tax=unclassified Pseudomonas TaxID=196821 RepID=UPI002AC8DDFE|nr:MULTISPECIES: SDR family oxidoreductase [unclassified Pseudomonas]MEB0043210.1 SDR family oxidoreductase [Pseudomonas sp. MH10]MEB0080124.1 SDR family oxidoreductase [Pseudomonas sp. MH10out]MEB0094097.1 SDR family oxidoreductase [Pseudomonas sp. CCI4.2]MEB0104504.1 SDR family oxidoreductase [Pseudomonas sp. CCI3.2]MEB0123437.1 SDR family oxidoreductase [Pseudomonas sp. CCI1.2]